MTALPVAKLARVLAMLDSPYDGERAAAGLVASRMVRQAGLSWADVIVAPGWREIVMSCQVRPELLTEWETAFLNRLSTYRLAPSDRQLQALAEIARRVRR